MRTYKLISKYNYDETNFIIKINNIKVDGNKLKITGYGLEKIICIYYFESLEEKDSFISEYEIGDIIKINGTLNIPKNNTIENTFNYKKYLYHNRITYILNVNSYDLYKSNTNIFNKLKNLIIRRINNINNDYLYAFILGDSSKIDENVYNNYRINGITHLFALSGLHVSIFSGILLFILKKVKCNELLSFIIVSTFLILFSFIASFTPSILRATIFFILSSLNNIYYFFIKPKNLLYLTFSILIFIDPFYIFNLGFILSFTITYFLLLSCEEVKINKKILSILYTSFISFISSIPIIINNFYELNIIGFINNLFFIPFVSYIIFPLSILVLIFNKLSFILTFLTNIMEYVSFISSKYLNINISFSKMSIILLILYYVLLIVMIKYKRKGFILSIIMLLTINNILPLTDKNTYIYFLDVGQGDSILIRTKNNKNILIDTGGSVSYYEEEWKKKNKTFNIMKDSIIPSFKSIGIKKIDYLFITHGDSDHIGNAKTLVDNFKVDNIFINKGKINYQESILTHNILLDNYMKIDNITIKSLNNNVYDSENDNSIVLLVKIYDYQILLLGDVSKQVERDIISIYNLKNIDIIKLAHHGSNTSTSEELISILNPKVCIISVSKNNKFNHPSKETILLLNKYNILYYETSKHGSIKYTINEKSVKQNTFIP